MRPHREEEAAVRQPARDSELPRRPSEHPGVDEVDGPEAGDPLGPDGLERDLLAEGEPGEERELAGGVGSFDVRGGVGLGVPERLGLGQDAAVRARGPRHSGQDEVAGAVQDPGDGVDPVAREALPDRAEDRDTARDGRLERECDALLPREASQLGAPCREEEPCWR